MIQPSPSSQLPFRQRLGRLILALHGSLLVLSLIYYLLRGFDLEELAALFAILAPIAALYGGIAFKSIAETVEPAAGEPPFSQPKIISKLVWGHFIVLAILISLKALAPNWLNFKELILLLGIVESYFGAHMGSLMQAVFNKG